MEIKKIAEAATKVISVTDNPQGRAEHNQYQLKRSAQKETIAVHLVLRAIHSKYQYIDAIMQELELAASEPDWCLAYTKAEQSRRLLASQISAIQQVCCKRLYQLNHAAPTELQTWLSHYEDMRHLLTLVMDAVDHHQPEEAAAHTRRMRVALHAVASQSLIVLDRVAELTGDLSVELASALRRLDFEND